MFQGGSAETKLFGSICFLEADLKRETIPGSGRQKQTPATEAASLCSCQQY